MAELVWERCRGINQFDSPLDVREDMAADARNMHRYDGALGSKRAGSTAQTLTGTAHTGYSALIKFLPGQDETAAELFIVDSSPTNQILRVAAGTAKAALTLKDNIASRAWDVSSATLNGKLYFAYDGSTNRLKVFDPGLSTTSVRYAGMGTPAAPTAATLGGAGLTFTGTYKVAYTEQRSSVTVRRSELSALVSLSITDDSGIQVTKPASISEGETHWELYRLGTDDVYYLLATTVVGTTTVNDTSSTPPSATAEAAAGTNTPFPSVKFIATDGNRLLGFGVYETTAGDSMTPRAGRVYIGPVLDSSSLHDDERISNTTDIEGWIDISRNAGSLDRGISPKPLNGVFHVFQSKGIHALIPTGSAVTPFRRVTISGELGALNHHSIVMGEDKAGKECLYFLDPEKGPYRIGRNGLEWCGKDITGTWATVNLAATGQVAWGVYFKKYQWLLFGVATGSSNDPDKILVFDVSEGESTEEDGVRGGWDIWDGDLAASRCAVLFAETMGVSMSRAQTLYVGRNSDTKLLRYNTSVTSDDSVTFRGYQISKAHAGESVMKTKQVTKAYLLAEASSAVTLTLGLVRNFGDETTRTDTALLTAAGSESRVLKRFESPDLQDAYVVQLEIGDASAAATAFTLERLGAVLTTGDYKSN